MSVQLTAREVEGVLVLDISGRVTVLDQTLRNAVNQFLKDGNRQFALNLSAVSYIDSYGLGELVTLYTSITNAGGRVRLLSPSDRVRHLLSISRLDAVFDVADAERPLSSSASGDPLAKRATSAS